MDLENLYKDSFAKDICTVKVSGPQFKSIFAKLKKFFKKGALNQTIRFVVTPTLLRIEISEALNAMFEIEILEHIEGKENMTASYIFSDIESMIPGSGEIELQIASSFLKVQFEHAVLRLNGSMTEITKVDYNLNYEPCPVATMTQTLKAIKFLSPLSKYTKKYPPIHYRGDYMQVLYPSIYIQGPSKGLNTVLDYRYSMMLLDIILMDVKDIQNNLQIKNYNKLNNMGIEDEDIDAEDENEEYEEYDVSASVQVACKRDILYFKNKGTYLALTKGEEYETKDLNEVIKSFSYLGHFSYKHFYNNLKKLQQTIGECEITVDIYPSYCQVRAIKGSNSFDYISGEAEQSEDRLLGFRYYIELLTPIIGYIGDDFDLYAKGGILCFKADNFLIEISVIN